MFQDGRWINIGIAEDFKFFHLYALSGILVDGSPVAVIPEPSSLILTCIGAVLVVGYGARRKRKTAIESNVPTHQKH